MGCFYFTYIIHQWRQNLNRFSKTLTQEVTNPAAQAMLYGIGLKEEDFAKPQIGIASTGYEGNPCNMHLNGLVGVCEARRYC
jgi:dihydroxyacid dehydratase/phosphogluconate dehydratase